jgi:hypothetical protein
MNKAYFLFLINSILILSSCQKEENEIPLDYPSTFTSRRFESSSKVRLFTASGEITSSEIIHRFSRRLGENYLHTDGISIPATSPDTIRLSSANSAWIKQGNAFQEFLLTRNKEALQFTPKDTAKILDGGGLGRDLVTAIGKYKPIYHKVKPVPLVSGYGDLHEIIIGKYARINNAHQIEFPFLNYVFIRKTQFSGALFKYSFNNQFDESSLQLLKSGDTLAVQEFKLIYEK